MQTVLSDIMEPGREDGKAAGKQSDNPEECPVCMKTFDDTVLRPHTLPCGHIYCGVCIDRLKKYDQVTCPACRVIHTVPEAGQFPICYAFEAFIKKVKDATSVCSSLTSSDGEDAEETGTPGHAEETGMPGHKWAASLSKSLQFLLKEQRLKGLATIIALQRVESQLQQYRTDLLAWHDQQQQLEDKLQALLDESKKTRQLVRQEESRAAAKEEEVQQEKQQLQAVLETLCEVKKNQEAGLAVVDVVCCVDEANQKMKECREMYPDVHTATSARKVRVAARAGVEAAETVEGAAAGGDAAADADAAAGADAGAVVCGGSAGDPCLPVNTTSTITEKFQALQAVSLEVEDLRNLTHTARILVQDGLVFASHITQGQVRHARITLEEQHLYLHSLQDRTLPFSVATLQMDEVLPSHPPCLAFLDLSWPGSAPHRVLIRVSPNTQMGQQFVLMCTGQKGPTYLNTHLHDVINEGQAGETVWGGFYENENGEEGAAILPDLDMGQYRRSGRAGSVHRLWPLTGENGPERNTWFGIYTRDSENKSAQCVFGEVVEGLEGVVEAAKHSPIEEVTVVDCGVVLWQ